MHKEILRAIAGIEVFPVISLILFVSVFTIALVRVIRMDSRDVDDWSRLPLDGDSARVPEVRR